MRRGILGTCVILCGCIEPDPAYGDSAAGSDGGSATASDGAAGSTPGSGSDTTTGSGGVGGTSSTPSAGPSGTTGASASTVTSATGTGGGSGNSATTTNPTGSSTGTGATTTGGATTTPGVTTTMGATTTTGGVTTTTGAATTTTGGVTTTTGSTDCSRRWAEPGWTLSPPEELSALNTGGFDGDPYLSADGMTLYFASDRQGPAGESDVFFATRPNRGAPFGAAAFVPGVNTTASEWTFAVAESGLLAFLNSDRGGGSGGADLWELTRATVGDAWGNATPVMSLNSAGQEWDAFTMPDGLTLYYNVGGSNADNFVATRATLGDSFGAPTGVLNSPDTESTPTLSADGLVIVFGSYRPGGMGSQDLWYATRATTTDAWTTPQPLPVVNTPDNEGESHLRYDGCELFFTTGTGGVSSWDLYRTEFVPP